jgi:hypothetical protein
VSQKEVPENADNASIQETMESRQRRGKYDSRPTLDCQKGLYTVMLQAWEQQGCPIDSEGLWQNQKPNHHI